MPFGKYKGQELDDIIEDCPEYIVWMKETCNLHGELKQIVTDNYVHCKKVIRGNDIAQDHYDKKEWVEEHGGDPYEMGYSDAWGWDHE